MRVFWLASSSWSRVSLLEHSWTLLSWRNNQFTEHVSKVEKSTHELCSCRFDAVLLIWKLLFWCHFLFDTQIYYWLTEKGRKWCLIQSSSDWDTRRHRTGQSSCEIRFWEGNSKGCFSSILVPLFNANLLRIIPPMLFMFSVDSMRLKIDGCFLTL